MRDKPIGLPASVEKPDLSNRRNEDSFSRCSEQDWQLRTETRNTAGPKCQKSQTPGAIGHSRDDETDNSKGSHCNKAIFGQRPVEESSLFESKEASLVRG